MDDKPTYEELEQRIKELQKDALERKQGEEALQESEEKFRLAFENAVHAIYWANPETGLITDCNKAAETLLEKRRDEIIGQHQTRLHPPHKAEYYSNMFRRHIERKGSVDEEAEVITKSGKIIPVHITASVTLVGGKPIIQGIFRDITERKRAEEELREREERYRHITEAVTDYIYTVRIQDGSPVETIHGPACVAVTGYGVEDFEANPYLWIQMVHEEDRQGVEELAALILSGEEVAPLEHRIIRKDGAVRWVRNTPVPNYDSLGRPLSYDGLIQDITERKRTQEALRESQKRYKELWDDAPVAYHTLDTRGIIKQVNQTEIDMLGYTKDEMVDKPIFEFILPEQRKEAEARFRLKLAGENVPRKDDRIYVKKDGSKMYVSIDDVLEYDSNGKAIGVRTTMVDVSERKRAEEVLRESEKKYTTLVESSLTGIYIDQDEQIVFANNRFAEIYRYRREELTGIQSWRLVHPEDRALSDVIRKRRLKGQDAPQDYNARGLTKDGETIWIKRRNRRIEYKGRAAILGNIVDITEQKRAEEELRKINEELKNFVHIVSHDLKTPIISIQGFSSRLLKVFQDKLGDQGRRYLEQIKASSRRMEVLVSDLLKLSWIGQVVSTFKDISSIEIVKNVTSALQDRLKESDIELVVADHLPAISCDGERIYQVFENLLVNAIKFTGGAKNPQIEIGYEDRGDFHQFYVRDNGIGIDPKYHRRIFELFHRLKLIEDEEGTGLGLAIVERIVSNHGGKVWVESEKGKGSIFYFTLPKAPSPVTHL